MITKLTIKTNNTSVDINNPKLALSEDIDNSVQNNTISMSVKNPFSLIKKQQAPYISSIQTVQANSVGDIELLGDMCTSVIDSTDPDYTKFQSLSDLVVFDGCAPCSSCDKVAQLQEIVKDLNIWIDGMKDCQLYYQLGASHLWEKMIQKKQQQRNLVGQCTVQSSLQRDFNSAVRLLYQYKALVYMWNYLVFLKSGNTEILQASQSYAGFVARSKRSIDTCGGPGEIKLHIRAKLIQGQTPENIPENRKMFIFAALVQQNTGIQYNSTETVNINQQNTYTSQITLLSDNTIDACITFNPPESCKGIFTGGIKVLPVLSHSDLQISNLLSLDQYIQLKQDANYITKEEQKLKNIWQIEVWWQYDNFGSQGQIQQQNSKETKIYTTGYYTYPQKGKDALEYLF